MHEITVNGRALPIDAPGEARLLGYLRSALGLTGAKPGCGEGECGACTVLLDGEPVLACQTKLADALGRSVLTVEGLASDGGLHPVQEALLEEGALQCGYCTPAMALRAAALVSRVAAPSDAEIAAALGPNLCRCGCYPRIRRALHRVATSNVGSPTRGSLQAPPAMAELPRPARPWDLCEPDEPEWFDTLGDGLVSVWLPSGQSPGLWPAQAGAWVHVGSDSTVTAFTGKVDVGQDNTTAFRLLVAEELGVPFDRVRVVLGDTDICPFDMGTYGSLSMPVAGEALRRAAAGAKAKLIELAGRRLEAGAEVLGVEAGIVRGAADGPAISYAELLEGQRLLEVLGEEPHLSDPRFWDGDLHRGARPDRRDAVTGERRFISDLVRPGMLHGAVLRPPSPGSVLETLDLSAADSIPGVKVMQDRDFVAVAAPDRLAARRALALIKATWKESSPPVSDLAEHLRTHPIEVEGWGGAVEQSVGDLDAALLGAAITLEETYSTAYVAHTPLETRAALAEWEEGRLTVLVGTQVPFGVRSHLADCLQIDEAAIRVIVPPTGGGFGGKHGGGVALEAALIARVTNTPVLVHWSRAEEMAAGYVRPMAVIDVRAGLGASGELVAFEMVDINGGPAGSGFPYRSLSSRFRYQPADSPLAQGSYRALAAPSNHFARECTIDELAHASSKDPLAFRLEHLSDERLAAVLRAAAGRFGWDETQVSPSKGRRSGIGVAVGSEKGGRVATCAEVCLEDDSTVQVRRIVTAYECGTVVNPDTVVNQIEGGTVMALGPALFESFGPELADIRQASLSRYRVPRFEDVGEIEVVLLERPDLPAAGAGETPLVAVAPAIANALFAATGHRLRSLPLVPEGLVPRSGSTD